MMSSHDGALPNWFPIEPQETGADFFGRSSFTWNQVTCASKKPCIAGSRSIGSRKLARAMCSSPGHWTERKNRLLPQREQKPRWASGVEANQRSTPAGAFVVTRASSTLTQVTNAAPLARWQFSQLQCANQWVGCLIEMDTAPDIQRHE